MGAEIQGRERKTTAKMEDAVVTDLKEKYPRLEEYTQRQEIPGKIIKL